MATGPPSVRIGKKLDEVGEVTRGMRTLWQLVREAMHLNANYTGRMITLCTPNVMSKAFTVVMPVHA